MKYQFIAINRYCVGDSFVETISEKTLQEYLKGFPVGEVLSIEKGWSGYDDEEYTYIWKKVE